MQSFLRHLREKGLDRVPEPLSLSDETESAARLLRRIHDASADWVPPHDAVFNAPPTAEGADVFVHGDPGPWSFVWRDGEAIALLDWDFLHPAPRLDDVAYALLWFAPMRDDDSAREWHHFPEPQKTWVAEGSLEEEAAEIRWIDENRALFAR